MDLTRDDMAEAVADAFRYGKIILAAASYDACVFPPMEDFLHRLAHKNLTYVYLFHTLENTLHAFCCARRPGTVLDQSESTFLEILMCKAVHQIHNERHRRC